jgi:hypothetical protein
VSVTSTSDKANHASSFGVVNMVTKAHILREIKQTAEANGGKPLGRQKFESETGIKVSDWSGKLWVNWNDVIRDAGYLPNQLSRPHDIAAVLDKYAGFTQELGHLPVKAELQLKRRSDRTFPSHNVFWRFGTKLELVEHLAQYCRSQTAYDDVVRLCEEYLSQTTQESANEYESQEEQFGFVYLIKSGRYYKIGKAKDADYRVGAIRLQLPENTKRIHTIRTDDPSGFEAYWHKRFEAKRKNGEWFELDATDVAAFKRRKFM